MEFGRYLFCVLLERSVRYCYVWPAYCVMVMCEAVAVWTSDNENLAKSWDQASGGRRAGEPTLRLRGN